MALGRHWAGGGRGSQFKGASEAFGTDSDRQETDLEIWPEHVQAWHVFAGCGTQWRVIAGMGGVVYQGLEYTSVEAVMRLHDVTDRARCMAAVQCLEIGARESLNR